MVIMDLNGKQIKHVTESANLKEDAEKLLYEMLAGAEEHVSSLLKQYKEFPELASVMEYPIREFADKIEDLKTIIEVGALETNFLGIQQQEDYTDMRKDLLKEAMYYIENNKSEE